jgi:hypothetical protein
LPRATFGDAETREHVVFMTIWEYLAKETFLVGLKECHTGRLFKTGLREVAANAHGEPDYYY